VAKIWRLWDPDNLKVESLSDGLKDDAELEYEPEQSLMYHIPSNSFDAKKDGYIFLSGHVGLSYYHDESLEIMKLERLHRENTA
jgi:hypothetical protein